jgi:hypothetical protein
MAVTIWLLRQGDKLGKAGRFYKVDDELGAHYVAKGWAQPAQGGPLRKPDPAPAPVEAEDETPTPPDKPAKDDKPEKNGGKDKPARSGRPR